MLVNNREKFEEYVKENNFSESRVSVLEGVYKKMSTWEISTKKSVRNATKKELIGFCQSESTKIANRSYGAMRTRVDAVNNILKWLKLDIKLSMTDFNTKNILIDDKTRYFTKEEMQDICNLFINAQDKFIVYAIFCGIYGRGYKDILELKVSDVDLENRTITTPSGKVVFMDDYLLEVATDTIDPIFGKTYYKYMTDETQGTTTGDYELNMSCKYVLKAKPYSKNNNGLDPMKVNGIQRRLIKLSEVSGFHLSGIDIYRSGIMDRMYQEEVKNGVKWTCAELEKWLKKNDIKCQVFELYRLYKNKYKK